MNSGMLFLRLRHYLLDVEISKYASQVFEFILALCIFESYYSFSFSKKDRLASS